MTRLPFTALGAGLGLQAAPWLAHAQIITAKPASGDAAPPCTDAITLNPALGAQFSCFASTQFIVPSATGTP